MSLPLWDERAPTLPGSLSGFTGGESSVPGLNLRKPETQAAIRAGYSKKTAGQIGEENLKKPEIQAALAERMKARERQGFGKGRETG